MSPHHLLRIAAILIALPLSALPAVRAWEDTITLPTYLEGRPDINPVFDALSSGRSWYPYPSRTNLTTEQAPQSWRRLNLENEYLACSFLPDLGGHLYSCIDKLNGHPLFHTNPAIKKALIGSRGAWVATGIEMNFPLTHSLSSVSPVNFGFRQEQDRGIVWLGAADRVTGMEWTAEFILESGSAVLRQNMILCNPTSVRHRYQWWNNAAVALEPGQRFVMPTRLLLPHGGSPKLDTWPVNSAGLDQSIVANHKDGIGLFAYGSREPFLAVYNPASRTGTIHVADPAAVPGNKIWTWGTIADAEVRRSLSDNNSQYIEIQAGLFATQDMFQFLAPGRTLRFTEYWIGARDLGGISRATVDGVLNLERRQTDAGRSLGVELGVTHAMSGARILIRNGPATVMEETADLDPKSVFRRTIGNAAAGAYRFELLDAGGKLLLGHTEGSYDATPPSAVKLGAVPQPDWSRVTTEQNISRVPHTTRCTSNFILRTTTIARRSGSSPRARR